MVSHATQAALELSAVPLGCSPHPAPQGGGSDQSQPYLEPRFECKGEKQILSSFQNKNVTTQKGIGLQRCQILETWQKVFKEQFHKAKFFLQTSFNNINVPISL